ncbi:MAG: hypothetical protein QG657_1696 [Acidobacteriota bacterium]|nr:hypothetical protein [Acidobacteriota bacterium]
MLSCESFSLRRLYPGDTRHGKQFYSIPIWKSRERCKQKYPQGEYSLFPKNDLPFTSVYGISIPSLVFNSAMDSEVTFEITICTSFFPAAHELEAIRLHSPWLSIHAALVSFQKQQPTEHTEDTEKGKKRHYVQNNDSHSQYTLPASQRLNIPGIYRPPGLQLITISTFVMTGAISSAMKRPRRGRPKKALKAIARRTYWCAVSWRLAATFYYKKRRRTTNAYKKIQTGHRCQGQYP